MVLLVLQATALGSLGFARAAAPRTRSSHGVHVRKVVAAVFDFSRGRISTLRESVP